MEYLSAYIVCKFTCPFATTTHTTHRVQRAGGGEGWARYAFPSRRRAWAVQGCGTQAVSTEEDEEGVIWPATTAPWRLGLGMVWAYYVVCTYLSIFVWMADAAHAAHAVGSF